MTRTYIHLTARGKGISLHNTQLIPDNKPNIPAVQMFLDHPLRGGAIMTADEAEKFGIALIQLAHVARTKTKVVKKARTKEGKT